METGPSTSNDQPPPYDYSQHQQQQQNPQQKQGDKAPYPPGQGQGQQSFQPNLYPSTPMNSNPGPGGYAQPPPPQFAPQPYYGQGGPQMGVQQGGPQMVVQQGGPQMIVQQAAPQMVVQQGAPPPVVIVQTGGPTGNCPHCRVGILRIGTPTWAIIMMVIMIFVCWPLAFIFCCFHERRCGSCTYRDSQSC